MSVYDKIAKETVHNFLKENGYSIEQIRVMESRKKISAKAAILITATFKHIELTPNDFYLSGSSLGNPDDAA